MHEGGPEPTGSFYRFTPMGALQRLALPHIAIANSIAFSPDGETMYWCDTHSRRIHACDYDGQTGEVANIRVFADLRGQDADGAHKGSPDGSIVDADGCLWNAEWGGNRLTRYAPDGRVLARMSVPASQPTCPAFGGEALDTLYLTTARDGLSAHRLAEDVNAGATFQLVVPNVRGLPEGRFGHAYVAA
jgi:L-arabinonolactonase